MRQDSRTINTFTLPILTCVRYLEIAVRFGYGDLSKMAAAVSTSVVESLRESVDINPAELLYSAGSLVLMGDGFTLLTQPAR